MVRSSENIGHVFFVFKFSHPCLPVFGFQVLSGVPLHFSSTDLKDIGVASPAPSCGRSCSSILAAVPRARMAGTILL